MPILLGLLSAVCWGTADFIARFSAHRIGAYRTLFFMQSLGFILLTIYLPLTGHSFHASTAGWRPWALAAVAGIGNALASLALYYSFQVGILTVVAPISSSYPALTVVLALLSGERLHALRGAGMAVTLLGVILAAMSFASGPSSSSSAHHDLHAHTARGVGWAICAAIGFGLLFWFLGFHVLPFMDSTLSVWVIRISAFSTLALAAAPARQSLALPRGSVWWLVTAVAIMDTAGFALNNLGLKTGHVSVVSVLVSLYGAVTVLLSWIFLREKLAPSQWVGVFVIFTGIVLISL